MSENAPPSRNPANNDTLTGMVKEVLAKFVQNLDDCLPCQVVTVSADGTRVQVQPMVQMVTTLGERITRAQLLDIPVHRPGGGGFVMLFSVKAGDWGWIKATDRDISLFLKDFAQVPPNTVRRHSFSDAYFVPDVMRNYTFAEEGAACLQSLDGSVAVILAPDNVRLRVESAEFELTTTNAMLNVPLNVAGPIVATGPVTAPNFIPSGPGGVPYVDHEHDVPDVAAGLITRRSGGPTV